MEIKKRIQFFINNKKQNLRTRKTKDKGTMFTLSEDELVELILSSPKYEQPLFDIVNLHIAREIIKMYDDEDWTPEYIAKHVADQYPQVGITTPNAITGAKLILKSRSLIK